MPGVTLPPRIAGAAAISLLVMTPAAGQASAFNVSGFTGLFEPANWDLNSGPTPANSCTPNGCGTLDSTTMSLTSGRAANNYVEYSFDISKIVNAYPSFTTGTLTAKWQWNVNGTVQGNAALPRDLFSYFPGGDPSPIGTIFNNPNGNSVNSDGFLEFDVNKEDNAFGFRIAGVPAGGKYTVTGAIADFKFSDNTHRAAVPGPVPVMAAMAAFAWSRKLRRRIASRGFSAAASNAETT